MSLVAVIGIAVGLASPRGQIASALIAGTYPLMAAAGLATNAAIGDAMLPVAANG